MTSEQDVERAVRAWVAQGSERLPDADLDAALQEISITPQRQAGWLAERFQMMNSNVLRFGAAAVAAIAAGVVGLSFLSGNVGGPTPTPTPLQSPVTLASGSFTAPLLASGVDCGRTWARPAPSSTLCRLTTVHIEAVGIEPRLRGGPSRSATHASGSMEVSDADGRFSVDVQCTRWAEELLIGGEVTDSTHDAAAEGDRVAIAFHPRTVISAALWFEDSPTAPTCGAFLESISVPIEVSNDMEPVAGVMRVGTYVADCDGFGCTELDR
jgi:hypothetical protein